MVEKEKYTISINIVNLIALVLIIPIGLLAIIPFGLFNGLDAISFDYFRKLPFYIKGIGFLLFLLGIPIHELLHALGWVFFTESGWKSVTFGINWEYLAPYCHCKEPLKRNQFLIGVILPFVVLGIIPVITSFSNGNFTLCFAGIFFSVAASGDLIALWMLRKVKSNQFVQDHYSEIGFIILEEK